MAIDSLGQGWESLKFGEMLGYPPSTWPTQVWNKAISQFQCQKKLRSRQNWEQWLAKYTSIALTWTQSRWIFRGFERGLLMSPMSHLIMSGLQNLMSFWFPWCRERSPSNLPPASLPPLMTQTLSALAGLFEQWMAVTVSVSSYLDHIGSHPRLPPGGCFSPIGGWAMLTWIWAKLRRTTEFDNWLWVNTRYILLVGYSHPF